MTDGPNDTRGGMSGSDGSLIDRTIPKRLSELERLHAEMIEARAPVTEGPVVSCGRPHSGRLLFGDATE